MQGLVVTMLGEYLDSKDIIANIKENPRNRGKREVYFDEKLYERRFIIERANTWIDGQKSLLVRYEKLDTNRIALHLLVYICLPSKFKA